MGLVSHRDLLRLVATGRVGGDQKVTVGEIMNADPLTVSPETSTVEVIRLMREKQHACLPVTLGWQIGGYSHRTRPDCSFFTPA